MPLECHSIEVNDIPQVFKVNYSKNTKVSMEFTQPSLLKRSESENILPIEFTLLPQESSSDFY